jgi:mycothiol synthase
MMLSNRFAVRPAEMSDLAAVVNLVNARSLALLGTSRVEETELQGEWELPSFDLETNTQAVLASDGNLVGYAALWDTAPHVRLHASVHVHPEWTGQGIGTHLGRWAEERAREAVSAAPDGVRVVLQQTVPNPDAAACALLQAWEYGLVRHFYLMAIEMDAPPSEPAPPEGIKIRPFVRATEAQALVHAIRDAFKDHWGYVEQPFEEDYAEWVHWMDEDPSFDEALWLVAVDGNASDAGAEIVGCSICYDVTGEGPEVGTVETLGVRRAWRRRGIASALLRHSFAELYRRKRTKVTLGVDTQSLTGALELYKKAGMQVAHQYDRYEKELRPGQDLSTQVVEE